MVKEDRLYQPLAWNQVNQASLIFGRFRPQGGTMDEVWVGNDSRNNQKR